MHLAAEVAKSLAVALFMKDRLLTSVPAEQLWSTKQANKSFLVRFKSLTTAQVQFLALLKPQKLQRKQLRTASKSPMVISVDRLEGALSRAPFFMNSLSRSRRDANLAHNKQ